MRLHLIAACTVLAALTLFLPVNATLAAQGVGPGTPAQAAPRHPDGRVNLGPLSGQAGIWLPSNASFTNPENASAGGLGGRAIAGRPTASEIPFQPWARALYQYRQLNEFEPHTRCKPSGGGRQFFTPYGVEFVDLPELKRIFIMDIGGPHTYRIVYMDGRMHPGDLTPSYYGHSIGRWEGDTLVVDTAGFNEKFWFERNGLPHTERLRFVERFTRTDFNTMTYEVTIDDPGAYTAPWSSNFSLRWVPDQEMFEYICQDNNLAPELMIGAEQSVDRSSKIVP
jgi:hypothetical protein